MFYTSITDFNNINLYIAAQIIYDIFYNIHVRQLKAGYTKKNQYNFSGLLAEPLTEFLDAGSVVRENAHPQWNESYLDDVIDYFSVGGDGYQYNNELIKFKCVDSTEKYVDELQIEDILNIVAESKNGLFYNSTPHDNPPIGQQDLNYNGSFSRENIVRCINAIDDLIYPRLDNNRWGDIALEYNFSSSTQFGTTTFHKLYLGLGFVAAYVDINKVDDYIERDNMGSINGDSLINSFNILKESLNNIESLKDIRLLERFINVFNNMNCILYKNMFYPKWNLNSADGLHRPFIKNSTTPIANIGTVRSDVWSLLGCHYELFLDYYENVDRSTFNVTFNHNIMGNAEIAFNNRRLNHIEKYVDLKTHGYIFEEGNGGIRDINGRILPSTFVSYPTLTPNKHRACEFNKIIYPEWNSKIISENPDNVTFKIQTAYSKSLQLNFGGTIFGENFNISNNDTLRGIATVNDIDNVYINVSDYSNRTIERTTDSGSDALSSPEFDDPPPPVGSWPTAEAPMELLDNYDNAVFLLRGPIYYYDTDRWQIRWGNITPSNIVYIIPQFFFTDHVGTIRLKGQQITRFLEVEDFIPDT